MHRRMSCLSVFVSALLLMSCGSEDGSKISDDNTPLTWEKSIGGDEFEQANAVVAAPGGGYVIAGIIGLGEAMDVYLVKIDNDGGLVWERTIGGSGLDEVRSIVTTPDGGYLLAGSTTSIGYGEVDSYLLKVDASGDKAWERPYGGSADDQAEFAAPLADGYVLASSSLGYDAASTNIVIITTDAAGELRERLVTGEGRRGEACAGAATANGGVVVAGLVLNSEHPYPDLYLLRLDDGGQVLWERTYGGDRAIRPVSIAAVNGGFAIAGEVIEPGMNESDAYLAKIDNDGELLWEQVFGNDHVDELHCVAPTADGGLILAGWTQAILSHGSDAYLVKTSAEGVVEWERTFGGDSFDEAFGVVPTPDGGYLLVGRTASFGAGGGDFYLIKTDAMGSVEPES